MNRLNILRTSCELPFHFQNGVPFNKSQQVDDRFINADKKQRRGGTRFVVNRRWKCMVLWIQPKRMFGNGFKRRQFHAAVYSGSFVRERYKTDSGSFHSNRLRYTTQLRRFIQWSHFLLGIQFTWRMWTILQR